jgi:WD40 repeat protein
MSSELGDSISLGRWHEQEAVLNRFEDAWRQGQRPAIDDFRPTGDADSPSLLAELVQTDLEFRLKAGEAARAEEYLARYPELRTDTDAALDLIATEYVLRRRHEPDLSAADYLCRFPEFGDVLRARLEDAAGPAVSLPGYEILGELGRGGMGVVYKARQTALNRLVALKVVQTPAPAGAAGFARFRREAEAAARLHHPNIVQIFEVGEYGGRPYLALEYVAGQTLAQRLAGAPLDARPAAELLETLARAMHHAHQKGVVHRDLKPSNILLARIDDRGSTIEDGTEPCNPRSAILDRRSSIPKIADFGLAKLLEGGLAQTHTGVIVGTPSYMAPEQAAGRGRDVGPAKDVYALGAVLYELLTGRPPFRAETPLATVQQAMADEPVPPSRLRPGVPRDLETICLTCLHKDPHKRYASAEVLADDLRHYLHHEPIRARPASAWERGVKWARRRPAAAVLLAVVLLAVLAAAGTAAWFAVYLDRALEARTHELQDEHEARDREARARQYVADLQLSYQFWKDRETSQGAELLARHQPAEGQEDLRGFEWYFLARQVERLRAARPAHGGAVGCVALTRDGKTLATGGADGQIKLWDLASWQRRVTLAGYAGPIQCLVFTPDGALVASAGADGVVKLWDTAGRHEPVRLGGFQRPVRCLVVSSDGRWLAAADEWSQIRVWDLRTYAERPLAVKGTALAFAPDGPTLAVATGADYIQLWDLPTGSRRAEWAAGGVTVLAFSPDGRTLAAGDCEGLIVLQDVRVGRSVARLSGHQGAVGSLAFTPDGRSLFSGAADGTVRWWDAEQARVRAVFRGAGGTMAALALTPDAQTLLTGEGDGKVRFRDVATMPGPEPLASAFQPSGPAVLSPDGKTLALADRDGSVKLVDPATGQVRAVCRGHRGAVNGVTFAPEGRMLATAGEDASVRIWDAADGRERFLLTGHGKPVACVAFAPDRRTLASGDLGGDIKLWDVAAGREQTTLRGHTTWVGGLAFTPDGQTLVAADHAGAVLFWDVASGQARGPRSGPVEGFSVAIAPDGGTAATGHAAGRVTIWDIATAKAVAELTVQRDPTSPDRPRVHALAFAPDGRTLATGDENGLITFWDLPTRRRRQELSRWGRPISSLGFGPGGAALVIVSTDGQVGLLDPARWALTRPPGQLLQPVRALAFADEGRTLFTGSPRREVVQGWRLAVPVVRTYMTPGFVYDHTLTGTRDDIRSWDATTGAERPRLPGQESFGVYALALDRDRRTLVAGSQGGVLWLWDLHAQRGRAALFLDAREESKWQMWEAARKVGLPCQPDFTVDPWCFALAPNGQTLAAAGLGGPIRLWRLPDGTDDGALPGAPGLGAAAVFSPDSTLLAVADGNTVQLWDVASRRLRQGLTGHTAPVRCLAFSPDGALLASGGDDNTIRLWDVGAGQERSRLIGHLGRVSGVAFPPDGRTLASGGWDNAVRLWSVAAGQELACLEAHRGAVHCVAFSPDGNVLASGGENPEGAGEVFRWRAGPR